jgi:hypothetical protein
MNNEQYQLVCFENLFTPTALLMFKSMKNSVQMMSFIVIGLVDFLVGTLEHNK